MKMEKRVKGKRPAALIQIAHSLEEPEVDYESMLKLCETKILGVQQRMLQVADSLKGPFVSHETLEKEVGSKVVELAAVTGLILDKQIE